MKIIYYKASASVFIRFYSLHQRIWETFFNYNVFFAKLSHSKEYKLEKFSKKGLSSKLLF